jgi:hypothetical protein
LWICATLSKHKAFESTTHAIILVFAASVILRVVPELVAYPYPIGYDVVNYYIPVTANFETHWPMLIGQFPVYVLILHLVNVFTGLSAHTTVIATATAVFGLFGVALFCAARFLLKLGIKQCIFVSVFSIFQMAVLRTAWDLHRDVFALAAMLLAFSLIGRKGTDWKAVALTFAFAALAASSDRMVGALFCITVIAWAAISRRKVVVTCAIFSVSIFSLMMVIGYSFSLEATTASTAISADKTPIFYNPQNLLIYFVVVNGLLCVPAAIGFIRTKHGLILKIPLMGSLVGSFSWLVFPELAQLVADRWIVLAGIFLSIFAGYGILHLVKHLKPRHTVLAACSVLVLFAVIGLAYATMSYHEPFILYGLARYNTEEFGPVTMQFNSLDVTDNGKMTSAIAWINENTAQDAVIVGEKHWRGFMEVYLQDQRTYRFSSNPQALSAALLEQGRPVYMIKFDATSPEKFEVDKVEKTALNG